MKLNNLARLKNFPISFLAVILGLIGLTLSWQKAEQILLIPGNFYIYLLYITIGLFGVFSIIYLIKSIKYFSAVKEEFFHPIKINFFPIIAKIFLILSIIFINLNIGWSKSFWFIGVISQFVFSLIILSMWIRKSDIKIKHLSPAWFIPIVGNVMIPIAGVVHGYLEISWFFFSIGLIMWLTLFVIVFNRLIFHEPLQDKLLPTLFILFAPPAIAFISYVKLIGALDNFSKILFYISLFLLLLVLVNVKLFAKIKFYLSWWAYSFPLAAITIANMLMYHESQIILFKYLSYCLFVLLSLVIILLLFKTTKAIISKQICIED